jgi:EF hand domain-containing protein
MYTRVLRLAISALILASGATGALAQERTTPQADRQQSDMSHGMMGSAAIGPPPMILRIMFALMDGDGDGTISLAEFQAAHERIFKAMDSNKDGKLTQEEMHAFMQGRRSVPQQ